MKKYFLAAIIAIGCTFPWQLSTAGDVTDAVREPIIRPNQETLKRWMFNAKIVLQKRSWWFDRTDCIEPSKMINVVARGGFVFQKPPPFSNYATSVWTFQYPDGQGKINNYSVTVNYAWSMGLTGVNRSLNSMIITGP